MRITRLYLRNYRVFEDELELEMPAGLVGIYGPNGGGKSSLIESIRWSLYGRSRTSNDEIRTSGVNTDCVTEIEFEHEGHLYLVRRTIAGVNHTVKAEAHWNGQQVAEGVRDVAAYVHSVIGMDDAAFRASVFAEQKQVAAFSAQGPQKRRELVLRLLGITPLDKARDTARADGRDARADHERLAARLPDLDELADVLARAEAAAAGVDAETEQAAAAAATARTEADAAEAACERLDDLARTYESLVVEGKGAAAVVDDATARADQLRAEQTALAEVEQRLALIRPQAAGIDELEATVRALEAVTTAQAAVDVVPEMGDEPVVDEGPALAARGAAERAAGAAAELGGEVRGAEQELARARAAAARSAELSPEEDCPVCGQSLGDAFEQVLTHRAEEVAAAETRLAEARRKLAAAEAEAADAAAADHAAATALEEARRARAAWEQQTARGADAETALDRAVAVLGGRPSAGDLDRARKGLEDRRGAATELARLEARLERAPLVERDLAATVSRLEEATATRDALREKVRSLAFKPDDLAAARQARSAARARLDAAAAAAEQARHRAAAARSAVETAQARLDDGRRHHADLADLADRARHLGRLGDLLNDFRNNVVAVVGPRLATQAAELFGELTDHEYDQLEVDPETYEIKIRDAGRAYGMDRFSGSETDLANLALRVAISEHVRFQSGGAVGLLVLDEVFGPLDDERKERMLLALERLRGRFRQVLVVTHDSSIKEQLPNAIQVVKLPGRRATATVLAGT